MKPRIFIGLMNIASQLGDFKNAFEELGCTVSIGVIQKSGNNIIQEKNYDYVFLPSAPKSLCHIPIPQNKINHYILATRRLVVNYRRIPSEIIKNHDVFIFIWSSFDRYFRDYQRLAEMGKKVVVIFCGDDARWPAGVNQEFALLGKPLLPYHGKHRSFLGRQIHVNGYNLTLSGLKKHLEAIRQAEKHAHVIFSKREQAQLQLRPFYHFTMNVPVKQIPYRTEQRAECPIVVHAPSNPAIKGTQYVMEAFERLRSEGIAFQAEIIQNIPNTQALEIYRNSDIVIDQLLIPGGGKLASEALAAGCVVLSRMDYQTYDQGLDLSNCPIIDVNPDTIFQVLKETILNVELRRNLSKLGRPFVEKNWDTKVFCNRILTTLEDKPIPFDFTPRFFRETYKPSLPGEIELQNTWIDYVKDCSWYKAVVPPGERDGLRF